MYVTSVSWFGTDTFEAAWYGTANTLQCTSLHYTTGHLTSSPLTLPLLSSTISVQFSIEGLTQVWYTG